MFGRKKAQDCLVLKYTGAGLLSGFLFLKLFRFISSWFNQKIVTAWREKTMLGRIKMMLYVACRFLIGYYFLMTIWFIVQVVGQFLLYLVRGRYNRPY